MKSKFKIIFMGTPEFAVPTLLALHEEGHIISLVATQPDRQKGRGRKKVPPPVKDIARELGYPVIQPLSISKAEYIDMFAEVQPDFIIVIAYGTILPQAILDIPKIAPINIHASLLPQYRGAAPIQWALLNGETETGVTLMKMDKGLDTGDIIAMQKVDILSTDTSATLHDRLSRLGAERMLQTLRRLEKEPLSHHPQNHVKATYAPSFVKADGRIDWTQPAPTLDTFIRGMTPWPGAFTFQNTKRFVIWKATPLNQDFHEAPGTVLAGFDGELLIATGDGVLSVLEIQGAAGKRLPVRDFLRGAKIKPGAIFH